MKKNFKTLLTPLLLITGCSLLSFLCTQFIHEWAFIPLALAYWSSIFLITKTNFSKVKAALTLKTADKKWIVIAYIPCLFCIVAFVWGIRCIQFDFLLLVLSILFMTINPIAEELFWRKYLFDKLTCSTLFKIIFTTIFFSLSHPLTWGMFSVTIRSHIMIFPLLLMGVLWGLVYSRTQSVRHCIIAHSLVDILNLSIWVFLNLYIPPVV